MSRSGSAEPSAYKTSGGPRSVACGYELWDPVCCVCSSYKSWAVQTNLVEKRDVLSVKGTGPPPELAAGFYPYSVRRRYVEQRRALTCTLADDKVSAGEHHFRQNRIQLFQSSVMGHVLQVAIILDVSYVVFRIEQIPQSGMWDLLWENKMIFWGK
ncbi:hypothetical protein CEXT_619561 [Caerostris extrusa]|uniref:Uncharacterized protein n=1 Tax=Caerostris extrusa TaxID=172846 RepID=A0AAV4XFD6_CAEEX|nr:hypothetical protein CEXT_619561 [Caerostris extrusa]